MSYIKTVELDLKMTMTTFPTYDNIGQVDCPVYSILSHILNLRMQPRFIIFVLIVELSQISVYSYVVLFATSASADTALLIPADCRSLFFCVAIFICLMANKVKWYEMKYCT